MHSVTNHGNKILKNNVQYLQKGNCSRELIKAGISGIQKTHSWHF